MAWIAGSQASVGAPKAGPGTLGEEASRAFLQRVHLFMSLGLGATGLVALAVASSPAVLAFIFGNAFVFPVLLVAELLLVIASCSCASSAAADATDGARARRPGRASATGSLTPSAPDFVSG
jgi:FtsH-binding integral membrane protein